MTKLTDDIIALRRTEGLTGAEIARRLGCSKVRVSQVVGSEGVKVLPPVHRNKICFDGANLKDPNRADKLLRRFSWQEQDA